jgi:hypothetical protein
MALETEIEKARQDIVADGYEMSVGEILNLYKEKEIFINPDFQRLFRWDPSRKTRFLESLLLGIPIPPIFVYQNQSGVWELIDGLQRLSTIFEFVGTLRIDNEKVASPLVLEGTRFLPSLANKKWNPTTSTSMDGIGQSLQLAIKRARIRVEILKQESDPKARYELFQRLNTGGADLSEQEVRNCVAVMLNKPFHEWLLKCSENADFRTTIDQTEYALKQQSAVELALRFFAFRNVAYVSGLDVHEYLDEALRILAQEPFDMDSEGTIFSSTFAFLNETLGSKTFKRWDGSDFKGKFLMSVFEVVATGVSKNFESIRALGPTEAKQFVRAKCQALWGNSVFETNSGAGVRGTTRLANLLPMAESFFRP